MPNSWGNSWGSSWGDSWGTVVGDVVFTVLPLLHSPADILRSALVGMGLVSHPDVSPGTAWPAYVNAEPMDRDNRVAVNDTSPTLDARSGIDGELWERHGVQIMLLAESQPVGYLKMTSIKTALAKQTYKVEVSMPGATYLLQAVTNIGGTLFVGRDAPNSHRQRYSLNAMMLVERLS